MDLNQMLVFAKVAVLKSFTKAGKELGIEKSNVSTKITKLENRLGVSLLNRTIRSVTLTEAGAGYYPLGKVSRFDVFANNI
jgi:DNA-binding transcriptional LysR family regulator